MSEMRTLRGGRPIRVLVAKPGLDGHDRGARVVARALRDAGMEVIYTGPRQTPQMVAEAALREGADVIGVSIHSGSHLTLLPQIMDELRARGLAGVPVVAGGAIPDADIAAVRAAGVVAVFGPGTPLQTIVDALRAAAPARRPGAPA